MNQTRRALVVDDSGSIRLVLTRVLTQLGFEVGQAADGAAGFRALESGEPVDLLVIDWVMPEMNGIELVSHVRSSARYRHCKILMVTSESELPRVGAALKAGVDEYVMKPFDREVVQAKLELMGLFQAA